MSVIHTATFDAAFLKATDVASVAGDKINGLKELSIESSRSTVEVVHMGDVLATEVAGHRTLSFSGSGDVISADTVQALLKTSYESGATVYLTVITDPAAAALSQGSRYAVIIKDFSKKLSQGGIETFDFKAALASTTITAV